MVASRELEAAEWLVLLMIAVGGVVCIVKY